MKKTLFMSLCFVAALFLSVSSVSACSCMAVESAEKELEKSQEVFIGKVVDIQADKSGKFFDEVNHQKIVTFEVSNIFKGKKITTVQTGSNSAMCGYGFKTGEEYLVYTSGDGENSYVSICGRTNLAKNNSDIQKLEEKTKGVCLAQKSQCNVCSRESKDDFFKCTKSYCENETFTCTKYADTEVIGGSKDAHGCLVSAGFSWSHVKQSCIQVFNINLSDEDYKEYNTLTDTVSERNQGKIYKALLRFKERIQKLSSSEQESTIAKVISRIENRLFTMDFQAGNTKAQKIYDIINLLLLEIRQMEVGIKNADSVQDCDGDNPLEQCSKK